MLNTVVLGRYRILRAVGKGGMGVVYLGRTEGAAGFARPVVIKRIRQDLVQEEETLKMFVREARILANLTPPGIVSVVDFGEEQGTYTMVLEYVHGYHLGQWLRYLIDEIGGMPVHFGLYIMANVLDALHYAHTFTRPDGTKITVVHRDVSPGNVLLDAQGNIKLLDFGIARTDESGEYETQNIAFKGKLSFSPPESFSGSRPKPGGDVYSCAVTLHVLLTGENPFAAKTVSETLNRVMKSKAPRLSEVRSDVSEELADILQIALAKDPVDRYQSAEEFATALRSQYTKPDKEVRQELERAVHRDFMGGIAEALGVESLEERDAAWRQFEDKEKKEGRGRSYHPLSSAPAAQELRSNSSYAFSEPTDHMVTQPDSLIVDPGTPGALPIIDQTVGMAGQLPSTAAAASVALKIVALASLLIAGSAVVYVVTKEKAEPAPRFLVVAQREATPLAVAAPAASVVPAPGGSGAASAAPTPSASAPATAAGSAPAAARRTGGASTQAASSGPDAKALTRRFQQRQGAVQGCFERHASSVEGRPRISVRFNITKSGSVSGAQLIPGSIAGTAVGGCILGVARSTRFGPQPSAFSFSIPIAARRL